MNERLTFFCDRGAEHGRLYAWESPGETDATLFQVYCRSALDDGWLACLGAVDDLEAMRSPVAAAGGGLIARTSRIGTETRLRVEAVPGAGDDPATELLLLNPGQEPEPLRFGAQDIRLAPGAFVLLPATREDQSTLLAFLDHLHRLPGDYRGLLLNVLRRPGIEAAIGRLEQRLDRLDRQLTPAAVKEETRPPSGCMDRGWLRLIVGLLVLNLLGVGVAALWIKGSLNQPGQHPVYRFEVPLGPSSSSGPSPNPLAPDAAAPTDALRSHGPGQSAGGLGPNAIPRAKQD